MKVWYIKEETPKESIFQKIMLVFRRAFNIIKLNLIDNKIVCTIPILKTTKLNKFRVNRIANKVNKKLYSDDTSNVVMSEYLSKVDIFREKLLLQNINILNGKRLFSYLIYDIVKHITKEQKRKLEGLEVSILVHDGNDVNIENIKLIAKNVKNLNIITNNIQKFKKVEEELYDELGIIVKISNNKKRALLKSDIIVNSDFGEELINKYAIQNNSIIININEDINIKSKRFNGINISYYNIAIPEKYRLDGFNNETMYESIIYKSGNFKNIREMIKNDKVKITGLIGNNGIICKREFSKT